MFTLSSQSLVLLWKLQKSF